MRKYISLAAVGMVVAVTASGAQASSLRVDYRGSDAFGPGGLFVSEVYYSLNGMAGSSAAGPFQLTGTSSGASFDFIAYCIDLINGMADGVTYHNTPGLLGASATANFDSLISNAPAIDNVVKAGAFQLAVWDIAYDSENPDGLGLSDGAFRALEDDNVNPAERSIRRANNWLSLIESGAWAPGGATFTYLEAPLGAELEGGRLSQNLLALDVPPAPVPLPAAGWLLAGAVAGLGAMRRKRSA